MAKSSVGVSRRPRAGPPDRVTAGEHSARYGSDSIHGSSIRRATGGSGRDGRRRPGAAWTSVERGIEHAAVEAEAAVKTPQARQGTARVVFTAPTAAAAGQPAARGGATAVFPVAAVDEALARTNRQS